MCSLFTEFSLFIYFLPLVLTFSNKAKKKSSSSTVQPVCTVQGLKDSPAVLETTLNVTIFAANGAEFYCRLNVFVPFIYRDQNLRHLQILCSRLRRVAGVTAQQKAKNRPCSVFFAECSSVIFSASLKTQLHNPGTNALFQTCPVVRKSHFCILVKYFSSYCEEELCCDIPHDIGDLLYLQHTKNKRTEHSVLNIHQEDLLRNTMITEQITCFLLFINASLTWKRFQKSFFNR